MSVDIEKPYEHARDILENRDREALKILASDEASYPEMLYFLSNDDDVEIRSRIAANASTPARADKVLSTNVEPEVREALGAKVARRLPEQSDQHDAQNSTAIAILEHLILDEEVRVRRIIAEALKTTDKAPLHIIQKLARDIDERVCTPILHHSPLLNDEELISIIEDTATPAQLKAIAERARVSEPLAQSIVETTDVEAISQLLLNPSAQIRENTLDRLIADAKDKSEWHEPLVLRPKLPFGAIRKIAEFVAGSLIDVLSQRNDIDDELREDLECRVRKRLEEENSPGDEDASRPLEEIELELRERHARGGLNEDYLKLYIEKGERDIFILSMAVLAEVSTIVSRRIFASLSAKAIMSLGWKAGLPASLSARIQNTVGNIPAEDWILPDENEEYPFTAREMQWQLALFLDQEESETQSLEMSDA